MLSLVVCLLFNVVIDQSWDKEANVSFIPGDACFSGVVQHGCEFLKGSNILTAYTNFNRPAQMEVTFGKMFLDLSSLDERQLASARRITSELLNSELRNANESSPSVLLFVVDERFDVEKLWLGVNYNEHWNPNGLTVRTPVNCFGPMGIAMTSFLKSTSVPKLSLTDKKSDDNVTHAKPTCKLIALRQSEGKLQENRIVISSDGSLKFIRFEHKPRHIIGYKSGDMFFVSNQLQCEQGSIKLTYMSRDSEKQELVENFVDSRYMSPEIVIRDVPKSVESLLMGMLNQYERDQKAGSPVVFLYHREYDVVKNGVGLRGWSTNSQSIPDDAMVLDVLFPWSCYYSWSRDIGIPLESKVERSRLVSDFGKCKFVVVQNAPKFPLNCLPSEFNFPSWFELTESELLEWEEDKCVQRMSLK